MFWKNGSNYIGQFTSGLEDGHGVFTFAKDSTSDHYIGEWKEGARSGKGMEFTMTMTCKFLIFLRLGSFVYLFFPYIMNHDLDKLSLAEIGYGGSVLG